ncbi:MAG: hypothetical protein SFW65_02325 [Alphaproteobacteria bacterium]|nr:hypothetical protein [Alphaproteobacteria bacterium]
MSISVFPLSSKPILTRQSARQNELMRQRVAHVGPFADGAVGLEITPIYPASSRLGDGLPHPSFSAQLLELGLKHQVEGLIQKANEQLSYHGALPSSAQSVAARHYERAQDNFAAGEVHMIERNF